MDSADLIELSPLQDIDSIIRFGWAQCEFGSSFIAWLTCDHIVQLGFYDSIDPAVTEQFITKWHGRCQALQPACKQEADSALNTALTEWREGNPAKLLVSGTDFQRMVWLALMLVPIGSTLSYSELANLCGRPRTVRAIASAVAANSIALLVPCHRIVPATGGTGNYRWGVERKRSFILAEHTTKSLKNRQDQSVQ